MEGIDVCGGFGDVKTLITEQVVQDRVAEMASQINESYAGQPLTLIGILTGSLVLVADLIRQLSMPLRVGVVQASSYRGETTRGDLVINSELMPDIEKRHVLLVDDIFDTGHTMVRVVAEVNRLGPKSVKSAVLLSKLGRQEVDAQPDFVGFEIPDEFVVGYGLDYRDAYRNLPFVAALEADDLGEEPA